MSKDAWIREHERATAEYLDRHPRATWERAYERTAGSVDQRLADRLAARADDARDREKYR